MDTMEITVSVDRTKDTTFSANWPLKIPLSKPGETVVGENISLHARITGRTESNAPVIRATAEITADGGEVLMDRFYFDLGETAFFAQADGDYRPVMTL